MTNPSRFIPVSGAPGEDHSRPIERGDTVLHAPSGTFFHNDGKGDLSMTLPVVTGVGIANLAEVADHRITRSQTTVAHQVRFHGGGELHFVHDLRGAMVELSGERVTVATNGAGLVSVSAYHTAESAPQT